jgi:hypothetical protein
MLAASLPSRRSERFGYWQPLPATGDYVPMKRVYLILPAFLLLVASAVVHDLRAARVAHAASPATARRATATHRQPATDSPPSNPDPAPRTDAPPSSVAIARRPPPPRSRPSAGTPPPRDIKAAVHWPWLWSKAAAGTWATRTGGQKAGLVAALAGVVIRYITPAFPLKHSVSLMVHQENATSKMPLQ